jgi:hypothetical protein
VKKKFIKKYKFTNNNVIVKKTDRKALYKMLVDIGKKIDPSISYNNYYLNYFE